MTDNFNYSLVQNEQGTYSIRSTVKSFNLDHVTDKDIVSFYQTFSQFSSIDTGLLPLDGTGVLAIRSAGPHTQIVTQHAPGMYHINWGAHEGDKHAKTYYVAQPYRIVIGDFENGNLLGARMFYSPIPITSPTNKLYHVNLPNINCRGYRGNGVGWICLYHNDDWSSLPFNEKVTRFIERCSGVETYNDANMSETDGPRFYSKKGMPSYLSSPDLWQEKSEEEGYQWTLNPDNWIPVLVKDMDNQGQHDDNGQPLTLAMAMLGNYQAYYTDTNIPKMYNIISRPDLTLTSDHVANFFKKSFAVAPVVYTHNSKDDPYNFTINSRQQNGAEKLDISKLFLESEDENEWWTCQCCEEDYDGEQHSTSDGSVCYDCLNDNYVFIEHADQYYHREHAHIFYSDDQEEFYHDEYDTIFTCSECSSCYGVKGLSPSNLKKINQFIHIGENNSKLCKGCLEETANQLELPVHSCFTCSKTIITDSQWSSINPTIKTVIVESFNEDGTMEYGHSFASLCTSCAAEHYVCPCGFLRDSTTDTVNCSMTTVETDDPSTSLQVTTCCAACTSEPFLDSDGSFTAKYEPFAPKALSVVIKNKIYQNINSVQISSTAEQHPF